MVHIKLEDLLPGGTGFLEFRKDAAKPLRELTQPLLQGTNTLTESERELIATVVSNKNEFFYCTTSHSSAADVYYGGDRITQKVKNNIETAPISDKMKALLAIAVQVQESSKKVTKQSIEKAKKQGATDLEIKDTVLIAALFCFYNRYENGLGTFAPADPVYYAEMAQRLKEKGYHRPKDGYNDLKNKIYE